MIGTKQRILLGLNLHYCLAYTGYQHHPRQYTRRYTGLTLRQERNTKQVPDEKNRKKPNEREGEKKNTQPTVALTVLATQRAPATSAATNAFRV
jgi:hypothetical protein